MEIRAICINDVSYDSCPVFILDEQEHEFYMMMDTSFTYPEDYIMNNDEWIVFQTDNETREVKYLRP